MSMEHWERHLNISEKRGNVGFRVSTKMLILLHNSLVLKKTFTLTVSFWVHHISCHNLFLLPSGGQKPSFHSCRTFIDNLWWRAECNYRQRDNVMVPASLLSYLQTEVASLFLHSTAWFYLTYPCLLLCMKVNAFMSKLFISKAFWLCRPTGLSVRCFENKLLDPTTIRVLLLESTSDPAPPTVCCVGGCFASQ